SLREGRRMVETLLMLLAIGAVLLLPAAVVLLIIALARTARIAELSSRLDRLEKEVRQAGGAASKEEAAEAGTSALPRASAAQPPRRMARPKLEAEHLESWIGRRALGWVAVVLLLFAVAFFLKYAFDNSWIG